MCLQEGIFFGVRISYSNKNIPKMTDSYLLYLVFQFIIIHKIHTWQFQRLGSMKSSREMLFFFISSNCGFVTMECGSMPILTGIHWKMKKKYGKSFKSISLELFVKHKSWTCEVWVLSEHLKKLPKSLLLSCIHVRKLRSTLKYWLEKLISVVVFFTSLTKGSFVFYVERFLAFFDSPLPLVEKRRYLLYTP